MAELINAKDDLNTGRIKINKAIEQSERAEIKSDSAVNTANSALNISNQANQKSDDTQTQLNNIILESGTSDAEVIQARKDFPVLNERLNSFDAQLADNAEDIHNNELELLEKLTQLKSDVTLTVGDNGDYITLNDAINHLTKYQPSYKKDGYNVEVKLLSGFIMKEQLIVKGMNLGWITITSEDDEVVVDRQSLQKDPEEIFATKSAFLGYSGAVLPNIGTIFRMNSTGEIKNTRVFSVRSNSNLYVLEHCGAKGHAERLLAATSNSRVVATKAVFSDCVDGFGIRISNSSVFQGDYSVIKNNEVNCAIATAIVNLDQADLTGAKLDGLRATTGPNIISASGADTSNSGRYGLHVLHSGDVGFNNGKANNCRIGIFIEGGGTVYASNAQVNDCDEINIKVHQGKLNFNHGVANNSGGIGLESIGSNISARHAQIKYATSNACVIASASNADLYNADISGSRGSYSLVSSGGSTVDARLVKARRGETDLPNDITIQDGGMIAANDSIGGLSDNPNTLTHKGIIFKR